MWLRDRCGMAVGGRGTVTMDQELWGGFDGIGMWLRAIGGGGGNRGGGVD